MPRQRWNPVLKEGLRFGLGLGLVLAIVFLLPDSLGEVLDATIWGSVIVLCGLAGLLASRENGRVVNGLWAGLFTAMVGALIFHLTRIGHTAIFFEDLRLHALEDRDFVRSGLSDYGAFIVEDILGGIVYGSTMLCSLGAAMGTLGGLIGRNSPGQPARQ